MNVDFVGRHFRVRDDIRALTEKKLGKVLKFVEEPIEIRATLEADKNRRIAELHLVHRHGVLQATEEAEAMEDAINASVDKIEKQARRSRKKFIDTRRRAQRSHDADHHWPVDVLDHESLGVDGEPKIVRSHRLAIKPMTIDEAVLQLKASKNEFFVFQNSTSDRINVLYRRRDQNYGLIAPDA